MDIRLASEQDRAAWDNFIIANSSGRFLQSWAWGEVMLSDGLRPARFMVEEGQKVIAIAQAGLYAVKRIFSFGYFPNGPAFKNGLPAQKRIAALRLILESAKRVYLKEKPMFFRLDAPDGPGFKPDFLNALKNEKTRSGIFAPASVAELDISKKEPEILAVIAQKTRYNIKRAQKLGVKITQGRSPKEFEIFYQLLKKTASRAGFHLHSKTHYEAIMKAFKDDTLIITASYGSEPLAALLLIFFGPRAIYIHGGSSDFKRNFMAPHLAQWAAIKEAKRRGCLTYDFGGASETDRRLASLTRFKLSFGAKIVKNEAAYEYVIRPGMKAMFTALKNARDLVDLKL